MTRRANLLLALLVVTSATLAGWWLSLSSRPEVPQLAHGTLIEPARILADFELVDAAGGRFGSADLEGGWHLLFFGFASCPDVCPLTLATLHEASVALDDLPTAQRPRVVMVSVDPGRDDPARLTAYVRHFDPDFIGVSGTRDQLDRLTGDLGVPVLIGEPDQGGYYSVDHGAALFLIDPRGQLRAVLSAPHEPAGIADSVRAVLEFSSAVDEPA
ncbi:MAG: SCO family protein [Steroidobacteraceae bacterium]